MPSSLALVSERRALTQRRGLVLTRFCGRTETETTNDPLGTPESGSSSTRTENCTFGDKDGISLNI